MGPCVTRCCKMGIVAMVCPVILPLVLLSLLFETTLAIWRTEIGSNHCPWRTQVVNKTLYIGNRKT